MSQTFEPLTCMPQLSLLAPATRVLKGRLSPRSAIHPYPRRPRLATHQLRLRSRYAQRCSYLLNDLPAAPLREAFCTFFSVKGTFTYY